MIEEEPRREKRAKVQFDLSADAERELDLLEELSGSTTRVDLIRRAMTFYSWFVQDVDLDDTLQVVRKDGTIKALIPARILKGPLRPA